MKFLADMGISMRTVHWLREQGYNVVHVRERNQHKASDSHILLDARRDERILLSMDLDFGYLLAISRARLPSVIIFSHRERASRKNVTDN